MTDLYDDAEWFRKAQGNLDYVIIDIEEETKQEIGFGWRASCMAPSTYEALVKEFEVARVTKHDFRVSDDNSEMVIHDDVMTNYRFRYWHDTRHAWLRADFSLEGEKAVTACQLNRLKLAGFHEETPEYKLIEADVLGQAMYANLFGTFPVDQRRFAIDCVCFGIGEGIDLAARRELDGGVR